MCTKVVLWSIRLWYRPVIWRAAVNLFLKATVLRDSGLLFWNADSSFLKRWIGKPFAGHLMERVDLTAESLGMMRDWKCCVAKQHIQRLFWVCSCALRVNESEGWLFENSWKKKRMKTKCSVSIGRNLILPYSRIKLWGGFCYLRYFWAARLQRPMIL